MHVTRRAEAKPCDAAKHFNMTGHPASMLVIMPYAEWSPDAKR